MEDLKLITHHTFEETLHILWKIAVSLQYLQECVSSRFLKEHESSTSSLIPFLKIHFNIIFPFTPKS
jgi:hypothetical protein